jgi:hypothetical protein
MATPNVGVMAAVDDLRRQQHPARTATPARRLDTVPRTPFTERTLGPDRVVCRRRCAVRLRDHPPTRSPQSDRTIIAPVASERLFLSPARVELAVVSVTSRSMAPSTGTAA